MPESKIIQACVNLKVPIFKKEHPDWEMKHVLAASYGYCRKLHGTKSDFFDSIFENFLKTDFYKEDYPVQAHTRKGKPVKAHERGKGEKKKPDFKEIMKVLNWLSTKNVDLEDQLQEFSEEKRNKLYSHDLVEEFDLLP